MLIKPEVLKIFMLNKCASFDEICRRASGRRAYNRRRRLERARRIETILFLQDAARVAKARGEGVRLTGRILAEHFGVHEATVSRDLKFIRRLRADYRRMCGAELRAASFKWLRNALGWEITFEMRYGARIR
jgi:hypothetical protein